MEIKFKKLRMLNFKGIKDRTVEFGENVTVIQGRNRIGKTTVADACWWVLFGKDSNGNAKFGLKTNGEDLQPIPRLDHEVELWITVDGTDIVLMRQLKEVWQHRRGDAEETLKSNTMVSFINGQKTNEGEYKKYIDGLCSESLFKVLSKSEVFFGLKPDEQRELLVRMVGGEKSADEMVAEYPEFAELVKAIAHTDLDSYMSGLAYKLKEVNNAIDDKQSRIREQTTELESMKAECGDFGDVRARIAEFDEFIAKRQEELSKPNEAALRLAEKVSSINDEIASKKEQIAVIRSNHMTEFKSDESARSSELRYLSDDMNDAHDKVERYEKDRKSDMERAANRIKAMIDRKKSEASDTVRKLRADNDNIVYDLEHQKRMMQNELGALEAKIDVCNFKMNSINGESVRFRNEWSRNETFRDEIQTVCPTCHQRLPEEELERIRKEADDKYLSEFNRLMEYAGDIKKRKEEIDGEIESVKAKMSEMGERIAEKSGEIESARNVSVPTLDEILSNDQEYILMNREYQAKVQTQNASMVAMDSDSVYVGLKHEYDKAVEAFNAKKAEVIVSVDERLRADETYGRLLAEVSGLEGDLAVIRRSDAGDTVSDAVREEIRIAVDKRDGLVKALGMESVIGGKEKRISELNDELGCLYQQRADIERCKQMARDYREIIIRDLEDRVNSRFSGIQFRMFETFMNGNVEPCCKCYIGVTEYKDGSHAERINAGLEMIDTMGYYNGVYVPIVVDDAEGINRVYETHAQQIRLVATMEDKMNIIHINN